MKRIHYIVVLIAISLIFPVNMERRKQLMSSSEVISSTETNLSYFYKFISIISSKETVAVRNKCKIALKNLNTLVPVIEKGNININILTLLTINGILWHPDPCNSPKEVLKYLELYYIIKETPLFLDPMLNLNTEDIQNKNFTVNKTTKTFKMTKNAFDYKKDKEEAQKADHKKGNITATHVSSELMVNETNTAQGICVTNVTEKPYIYLNDQKVKVEDQELEKKNEIMDELRHISDLKSVSSKSKEFMSELEKIYSEKIQ